MAEGTNIIPVPFSLHAPIPFYPCPVSDRGLLELRVLPFAHLICKLLHCLVAASPSRLEMRHVLVSGQNTIGITGYGLIQPMRSLLESTVQTRRIDQKGVAHIRLLGKCKGLPQCL